MPQKTFLDRPLRLAKASTSGVRCVETSREAVWFGIFCRESGGETQGYQLAVVIDHGRGVLDVGMNGFSPDHG